MSSNVPSVGGGYTNPSLMQASSGATGLIAMLIYEMMGMYAKIVGYDVEQKQSMVKAQATLAQSQADAQKQAGEDLATSLFASGGLTMAGTALGTAISLGAEAGAGKSATDLKEAETNSSTVKKLDTFTPEATPLRTGSGNVAGADTLSTAAQNRKQEFLSGNFSKAQVVKGADGKDVLDPESTMAIRSMKSDGEKAGDEGIEGKAALVQFRKDLQAKQDMYSRDINSGMQRYSNATQKGSSWESRISQLGNGGSSVAQGFGNKEKAKDESTATLAGTASNMAGSSANDLGTAMAKAVDAMLNEVQVLERVQQASAGR